MKQGTGKINLIDRLHGDKVVWIIVLFLCMISLVSIFSSTSQLASESVSRLDIVRGQMLTVLGGLAVILACYKINSIRLFKGISRLGFLFSFFLLMLLLLKIDTPIIKAVQFNGAWRALKVAGLQIHVFEITKVAMVMYLAWAINALKEDDFKLLDKLSEIEHLHWLKKKLAKEVIYIFLPTIITVVLVLNGGTSSALFLAIILFLTILLGGIRFRDILLMGAVGAGILAGCLGLYSVTKTAEHPLFNRLGTAVSRINDNSIDYEKMLETSPKGSKDYYTALDKLRQPLGAKIAVKEGGFLGKGPGASTQKYIVPVMYEDYIFSFIVEEYGLWGALLVIILYISLLARGSLIVRNCDEFYSKVVVAGLCLLIAGQGMFHIVINCDLGILTGQTLPLISHGTSSFLCFSFAFGVILSISRQGEKKMQKVSDAAEPLIELSGNDDIKDNLDILGGYEQNLDGEDIL